MRRRSDERHGHGEHRPHGGDKQQLQQQVAQLRRVIQWQNRAIVGLSSLFALVLVSTLVLVRRLPHPDPQEDPPPFWNGVPTRRLYPREEHLETEPRRPPDPRRANCSSYGCILRPTEMSRLNDTAPAWMASRHHLLLTHQSNRQKPAPINQDRAVLIPCFGKDCARATRVPDPRGNFFVGVFDGHDDSGHLAAQFASEEIPSRLAAAMYKYAVAIDQTTNHTARHEIVKNIFTQTFRGVEMDLAVDGGTTAVVILRRGATLYMANTGDSTSFLAVYRPPSQFNDQQAHRNEDYMQSPRSPDVQLHLQGTVTITNLNEKHKAHFPQEFARIKARGGRIHVPPKNPMGSRVVVRSALHGEDVGLAMSRSIGDREWTDIGVIPDPDVVAVDLHQFWSERDVRGGAQVFVVAGSDGIFDARKADFVARHVAFGLCESRGTAAPRGREPERSFAQRLIAVGQKLVTMASPLQAAWYRDDITVVAQVVEL